ncbi:MAG: FHA domain-containing protein [Candidatus Hydrogenedentes bacterium]|nr:FHA domain-containing protein [Candidatus Hydrogenedentota bacterium]
MRAAGQADSFVIINGPEDGTEFPVVRAPFHIGSESACPVQIRLDMNVDDLHALVTVVSDGYRVRRTSRNPVFVNGKRTGSLLSRIVRNGGTIQVGNTLLAVDCSPDGLARRSRGIVYESDFGWAIQTAGRATARAVRNVFTWLYELVRRLLSSKLAIASILFLLLVFWPSFRVWVFQWAWYIYHSVANLFRS